MADEIKPNVTTTVPAPKVAVPVSHQTKTEAEKPVPAKALEGSFNIEPKFAGESGGSIEIVDASGKATPAKIEGADATITEKSTVQAAAKPEKEVKQTTEVKPKVDEKKSDVPFGLIDPNAEVKPKVEEKKNGKSSIPDLKIVPQEKAGRDYSLYPQDIVPKLKQMSNEAFDLFDSTFKEKQELSKLKDANYLQHPDAYTLSPDYKNAVQDIGRAAQEARYLEQCLVDMQEGKKVQLPQGWNDKGQLVVSAEIEPTKALEEKVRTAYQNAIQVHNQLNGKLDGMKKTFHETVNKDLSGIQAERARRFSWVTEPKYLDWKIQVGDKQIPVKDLRNEMIGIWPAYMRENVAVQTVADMWVSLVILQGQLASAQSGQQLAEVKQAETQRAEPSSDARPAAEDDSVVIGKSPKRFSLDGMPS